MRLVGDFNRETVMAGIEPSYPSSAASVATREPIGHVTSVSGSQANLNLVRVIAAGRDEDQVTVGRFVGILSGPATIIGLISEIGEEAAHAVQHESGRRNIARLELIG